jgi:adenylyltransferase/sulfurtransferase
MALSKEEIFRYSRHLILPEVGLAGQQKLAEAKVLLIGAGGLGSPSALYLASAGVGTLGIVDFDVVDVTNLQRQIMHSTEWVGKPKVDSAVARLKSINPHVKVNPYKEMLTSANALDLFAQYDVIVDGTDNFQTRYLSCDAAYLTKKPLVYGSIFRFEGHATVFVPDQGPCYRCMYPEPPPPGSVPSCAEGGVLGILPGMIGVVQATEAVKLILGKGRTLMGRWLIYNAMEMTFRELKLRKDPSCPLCGTNKTVTKLIDYDAFCGVGRGQEEQVNGFTGVPELTVADVKRLIDSGKPPVLLDVREPEEWEINRLPGARLIPLGNLPARVNELDSADELLVYCHTGMRSARAVQFLQQVGFKKAKNVAGGIDAWSNEIDPDCPKY